MSKTSKAASKDRKPNVALGMGVPSLPPRGLRIEQVAVYSGLSCWRVELLVRSGELPSLKIGGRHYVVLREDVDAYLDHHRAKIHGSSEVSA